MKTVPPIADRILATMPYPVAKLYQEMLNEQDERIRFRSLIKVFAGLLKCLGIVSVADYMRGPDSDRINEVLSQSLREPSLGHWMTFFRSILEYYDRVNRNFHIREFRSVLSEGISERFDHLIHLRNTYVHPDILPPAAESEKLYRETIPHLHVLLQSFEFFTGYSLVRRDRDREQILAIGADIDPDPEGISQILVRDAAGAELDVTPFMVFLVDERFHDLLIYESLLGNRARYVLGNLVRFISQSDEPGNPVRLLQDLVKSFEAEREREAEQDQKRSRQDLSRSLARQEINVHALYKLSKHFSESVVNDYRNRKRYNYRTYVPRTEIQRSYERLLTGAKSALVVVADSGAGKSNEICRLYLEEFREDVVWVLTGRTTRADSVFEAIESNLFGEAEEDHSLSGLLATLDQRKKPFKRFVILFDGLNETDQPTQAFKQIDDFLSANPYPWLKLIITCRSFAWKIIESSPEGLLPDRSRYVPAEGGGLAHHLGPLDDDELAQALELYSEFFKCRLPEGAAADYATRKLLRTPLLLRFLFETFQEGEMPASLDMETILEKHTEQRIRERDVPFLKRHLMEYCYREETDVLDTRLLLERQREALSENGGGRLMDTDAYQKLGDHIFSEQVYEVDWVWLCSNTNCAYSKRPTLVASTGAREVRCNACQALMQQQNVDNRSTYSRLLDENILSRTTFPDYLLIRLTFDRYFEYLMAQYAFYDLMKGKYDPEVITELSRKAAEHSIFIEPLKAVLRLLQHRGEPQAIFQVAEGHDFVSYQVLRELFAELAEKDVMAFRAFIEDAARTTDFNGTICRAAAYALLASPFLARAHSDEITATLLLLSECPVQGFHDDVGHYLVGLRREEVDLFTPMIAQAGEFLLKQLTISRGLLTVAVRSRRREVRGIMTLLMNAVLFGLGNFFDDAAIRGVVVKYGLAIVHRFDHPLLSPFERWLARFVSGRIAKIYKEKGPLPCNYWEMFFQLSTEREAIRRSGDLFDLDSGNLFRLSYRDFMDTVHSENGLITWYLYVLLPVHYVHAEDRRRATEYLRRLIREGTAMDRYVAGSAVAFLVRHEDTRTPELEAAMHELGSLLLADLSRIFLHPEPIRAFPGAATATEYNRHRVKQIRRDESPYIVPWMQLDAEEIHRFYVNGNILHYELFRLQADEDLHHFGDSLAILEKNEEEDLLRFGHDVGEQRRFIISLVIRSLEIGAAEGYVKEVLATIAMVIRTYVRERHAATNIEAYRHAILKVLASMKEKHHHEVMAFLDKYDLDREDYRFLSEVKWMAAEKEKLFSISIYGHQIYQGCFMESKELREAFGRSTKKAADARNVEDFFFIYASSFMSWFKKLGLEAAGS